MNNTTTNVDDASPTWLLTTKITLYISILTLSFVGNILVILVVLKNKSLRTNFNILIVNMAISDLVIPCLALPMKLVEINVRPYEWLVQGPLGNFLCKFCYFAADISPVVSSFSLVIIAVNRYFAIAAPMKGILTRTRTLIFVAATWFLATLLLSPYFYIFRLETFEWTECISNWSPAFDDSKANKVFSSILITVVFAIPCVTIGILYSVMLWKLKANSNRMADMLNDEQFRRRQRKDKSIFIMTIVIMLLYLLLWGPFFFALFVLNFFIETTAENAGSIQTAVLVVQFIGYLNSVVNPCIYFCFLNNLREGLKRLFRGCFSCENNRVCRKQDGVATERQKLNERKETSRITVV